MKQTLSIHVLVICLTAVLGGTNALAQFDIDDLVQLTPGPGTGSLQCSPNTQDVDEGETATFTASGGSGGYVWTVRSSSGQDQFTGKTLTYVTERRGVYTVTLRDSVFVETSCAFTVGTSFTIGDGTTDSAGTNGQGDQEDSSSDADSVIGQAGQVETGPFAVTVLSLALAGFFGGLYLAYTHTDRYRSRELKELHDGQDPLDFQN